MELYSTYLCLTPLTQYYVCELRKVSQLFLGPNKLKV